MKLLAQNTLQAILDIEVAAQKRNMGAVQLSQRTLRTKFGGLDLRFPTQPGSHDESQLFQRYRSYEEDFLLLFGRTIARGFSSRGTIRLIAEALCGHPFGPAEIAAMASKIEHQLSDYLERERTRGACNLDSVHPVSGFPRVQLTMAQWYPFTPTSRPPDEQWIDRETASAKRGANRSAVIVPLTGYGGSWSSRCRQYAQ